MSAHWNKPMWTHDYRQEVNHFTSLFRKLAMCYHTHLFHQKFCLLGICDWQRICSLGGTYRLSKLIQVFQEILHWFSLRKRQKRDNESWEYRLNLHCHMSMSILFYINMEVNYITIYLHIMPLLHYHFIQSNGWWNKGILCSTNLLSIWIPR